MDDGIEELEAEATGAERSRAIAEGRATITETCASATATLRGAIADYDWLQGRTSEAVQARYCFTFGALLAFVPDAEKAELVALVSDGLPAKDPLDFDFGPDSTNLQIQDRP